MMSCDVIAMMSCDAHSLCTWIDKSVQCLHNACLNTVPGQGHLNRLVLELLSAGGGEEGVGRKGRGGRGGEEGRGRKGWGGRGGEEGEGRKGGGERGGEEGEGRMTMTPPQFPLCNTTPPHPPPPIPPHSQLDQVAYLLSTESG